MLRGKYIALNAILDKRISLKSIIQAPISKTNKKNSKNKEERKLLGYEHKSVALKTEKQEKFNETK